MQFENSQFERGIKQSTESLNKLDKALELKNGSSGLSEIDEKAKGMNFSALLNSVKSISDKFTVLGQISMRVLNNITDAAMRAGSSLVKSLTLDPIMSGFQEYETQIGAIQTILSNTESKGTTLTQVNQALDELNTYADKTIYNFTEMTRNIGTFTAAGVDLQTSVDSIKGLANLAAVSGSSANQASVAMYQLSQAIAAGRVSLMDWNSVVNAGMGGELFQNALKRTAENFGTNVDAIIEKYGSFRESLTQGQWLTTEVLTETLKQISGAYTEADLISQGYSEEQAKDITQLAKTAEDAATKVKTFSQLFDTLKEALQSGWTNSWEIIIGDFQEAQDLLTGISDRLGGMIQASADARNQFLSEGLSSGWKQLLNEGISNEEEFADAIKNIAREHGIAIDDMINDQGSFQKTLDDGWLTTDMLSESITSYTNRLSSMSQEELEAAGYTEENVKQLQDMKKRLDEGSLSLDEFISKMNRPSGRENIISALREAFDYLMDVIAPVKEAFSEVFPPATGEQFYQWTVDIKNFADGLKLSDSTASKLNSTFKGLFSAVDIVLQGIKAFINGLSPAGDLLGDIGSSVLDITASIGDYITGIDESIKSTEGFNAVTSVITSALDVIHNAFENLTDGFRSFKDILSTVGDFASGALSNIINALKTVADWVKNNVSIGDIFAGLAGAGIFNLAKKFAGLIEKISDIIDKFRGTGEKSGGDLKDLLDGLHESLESFQEGIKAGSIVAIAASITMLVSSVEKMSAIKPAAIFVSLGAIKLMMMELNSGLSGVLNSLKSFNSKGLLKAAVSMVVMAKAIDILTGPVSDLSKLKLTELVKGLLGVGVGLAELAGALKFMNGVKVNLRTSVAMLALAESAKILGDSVQIFSSMNLGEITRGLFGMGGALAELVGVMKLLSSFGNFSSLLGSLGIAIAVQSLDEIATGFSSIGSLSWDEIGRGLTAMGIALGEFTVALGGLSWIGGLGSLFGGGAILTAVQGLDEISAALQSISQLSWEEIGRGLAGMGGALAEGSSSLIALNSFAGIGAIFSGVAILITVQSLMPIAEALQQLGSMSWDEIGRGLTAMGVALAELGVAAGTLGNLTGVLGILGGSAIVTAAQGLDEIANALQKLGSMSWDEIGRGLTAMGVALAELAVGGLANALSFLGAGSINTMASSLGVLADSVKKWSGITVPEGLGDQLAALANGVNAFTLSGWGADTVSTVAEPLGVMADSVKKWSGVTVPEGLGDSLSSLSGAVNSFIFGGFGAGALSEAAPGIGDMADAIKKWTGVTVPTGLESGLKGIANGVKAFTWAFVGGFSIGTIIDPLSNLPEAIKKWKDVTVPENLQSDLTSLANGVQSFTFAFAGGWSIDTIIGPLTDLAGAVQAWSGVSFSTLSTDLQNLSTGLLSLANTGVNQTFVSNIKMFGTTISNGFQTAVTSATTSVSTLTTILTSKSVIFGTIAARWMTSMTTAIATGTTRIRTTFTNMIVNVISLLNSRIPNFRAVADQFISVMISAIQAKSGGFNSAISILLSSGLSEARTYISQFEEIGGMIGDGMANGILKKSAKVAEAAAKMAADSYTAAMNAIDAHSPSRLFRKGGSYEPEGMALGIRDKMHLVEEASRDMAAASFKSLQEVLSGTSLNLSSDVFMQPIIKPVLDLSEIEKRKADISSIISGRILNIKNGFKYSGIIEESFTRVSKSTSVDSAKAPSVNFTQNNYSPKSLSRTDIYRDSKNLLSRVR